MEKANDSFQEAEKLEEARYLYVRVGVLHTEYLIRAKDLPYANSVATANLEICTRNKWISHTSMCHRVLGDLDVDGRNLDSAREHYESALKIARSISRRDVLIEALLARERFLAKYHEDLTGFSEASRNKVEGQNLSGLEQAFSDLNEALGYCLESGYRIYEADVRVALAWAYLANGEKEKAKGSAERALQMSNEMGYHWGKVDAEEVLKAMSL
jgi:tetratricopeptide (TPR) repeat protein